MKAKPNRGVDGKFCSELPKDQNKSLPGYWEGFCQVPGSETVRLLLGHTFHEIAETVEAVRNTLAVVHNVTTTATGN